MPEEKDDSPRSSSGGAGKKLTKAEEQKLHVYFVEKVIALMTGAMGLVAALAWNDAIRKLFERVFGTAGSGDITAMFIYAVIVTAAIVIVTYRLTRFSEKIKKKREINLLLLNKEKAGMRLKKNPNRRGGLGIILL